MCKNPLEITGFFVIGPIIRLSKSDEWYLAFCDDNTTIKKYFYGG
jgi:hypothetical protein